MPNVRVFSITANDWTAISLPIACTKFCLENADSGKPFQYRSHAEFDAERTVAAGSGIEIDTNSSRAFQPGDNVGQVKGGVIVVSIGVGLAQRLTIPQSA